MIKEIVPQPAQPKKIVRERCVCEEAEDVRARKKWESGAGLPLDPVRVTAVDQADFACKEALEGDGGG
jgi:hypothetical protein